MFRGRFLEGLIKALDNGELEFQGDRTRAEKALRSTIRTLAKRYARWVVHIEPPNGRPVDHITKYLARYAKRVAISDKRIISVTETHVTFKSLIGQ